MFDDVLENRGVHFVVQVSEDDTALPVIEVGARTVADCPHLLVNPLTPVFAEATA